MNARHGDKKLDIICDISKKTPMVIVPVLAEREIHSSITNSFSPCADSIRTRNGTLDAFLEFERSVSD